MLKLFDLKKPGADNGGSGTPRSGPSAADLRIQKDLSELSLPPSCKTDFPDPNNFLNFKLYIMPDEGFYRNGRFCFQFTISNNYPHEAPKVKCLTQVYHPNIDTEGSVCLNILREDWNPILTISSVIYGLIHLFMEPNPEDPLNKEAAQVLQSNRRLFEQNVQKSMRGGYIGQMYFARTLR